MNFKNLVKKYIENRILKTYNNVLYNIPKSITAQCGNSNAIITLNVFWYLDKFLLNTVPNSAQ